MLDFTRSFEHSGHRVRIDCHRHPSDHTWRGSYQISGLRSDEVAMNGVIAGSYSTCDEAEAAALNAAKAWIDNKNASRSH